MKEASFLCEGQIDFFDLMSMFYQYLQGDYRLPFPYIYRERHTKSSNNSKEGVIHLKEYLSAQEAAQYTGISKAKLAKLRHAGSGCRYIRIGDSPTKALIRYRKEDLDSWLERNLIHTTGGL